MTKVVNSCFSVIAVLLAGIIFTGCSRRAEHSADRIATASAAAPASAVSSVETVPSDVELVKRGSLPEFRERTIGQAFEKTFQNTEWKSAVDSQGQKVVRLSATVKYPVLKGAGFYIGTWNGVDQGIEAEKQISAHRRECSSAAGEGAPDAVIESCMVKVYETMVIPVCFEFALSPDKRVVSLKLLDAVFQKFDPDHRLRVQRASALAFIYQ